MLDLPVGHRCEPGEHVVQVGVRIDSAGAATLDDGVEDGAALAGIGIAEEEPVLFPERRRAEWSFPPGYCLFGFGHPRDGRQAKAS